MSDTQPTDDMQVILKGLDKKVNDHALVRSWLEADKVTVGEASAAEVKADELTAKAILDGLKARGWISPQDTSFVTHTRKQRVQALDSNHISITSNGISFGKTQPPYNRAVIEYDQSNKLIRFHEASESEYGISYKVGKNRVSGSYGFRARPFEGLLPAGYYFKVGANTYRLAQLQQNAKEEG